jgi:hypothetical protein
MERQLSCYGRKVNSHNSYLAFLFFVVVLSFLQEGLGKGEAGGIVAYFG